MITEKNKNTNPLAEAQKEMRFAFLGGFAGQLVAGVIWLSAAAASYFHSPPLGMLVLFFGSMGIFPLNLIVLRMMGRPAKVSEGNVLWSLGSQIAFTVPINFLLVGVVILFRPIWFFPAAMIVVGAHYLPFITLYGMRSYALPAIILVVLGAVLALYGPALFSLGGWITGVVLLVFAFYSRMVVLKEEDSAQ